ncbi:MAG: BatD family protein [Deltaproteobacteria bacterium]|nr:BatD family protein [Deltaproteobacteria bacterium]
MSEARRASFSARPGRAAAGGGVFCVLVAAWLVPAAAQAQVSVTIRPVRSSVSVGEYLRVDVEISSSAGMPDAIGELPAAGFVQAGVQTSQSMQFSFGMGGGGQQQVTLVRSYTLQAAQAGTQTIGPVQVQLGSRVFSSGSVKVQVAPGSGNVVGPGGPGPIPANPPAAPEPQAEEVPLSACRRPDGSPLPPQGADGEVICLLVQPDVFLVLEASDARVYLGEPLRMQLRAFVETDMVGFSAGQLFAQLIRKEPAMEGFQRTNLEPTEISVETQFVQGRSYLWTTIRDKLLYPTRIGRLTIGPAEAVVTLRDFWREREIRRGTAALPIEVLVLPSAGKPDDFSPNNVGAHLTVTVHASPATVRAGEAIEVTLALTGEGNLAGFRIDPPEIAGATIIKSSDRPVEPTQDDLTAKRTVTFLVTPSAAGELDLSGFGVSYFDYLQERYARANGEPLRVAVLPAAPGTASTTASPGSAPSVPGGPAASIRPWNDLGRPGAPLSGHWWFWVLLLLPPVSLGGLYAGTAAAQAIRSRRGVLRPSDVLRRSRAVLRRVARGRGQGDAAAQLGAIESALFDFLEARVGEPLRGFATTELHRRLSVAGFPDTTLGRLVATLDTCAFGRFAPSQSRQQGAADAARGALEVLDDIDRVKLPKAPEVRS